MNLTLAARGVLVASLSIGVAGACGDDDADPGGSGDGGSGGEGGSGDGGSGDDGGSANEGGSGGDADASVETDAGTHGGDGICGVLASDCHQVDHLGSGDTIDDCHNVGHEGDEGACEEIYDECAEACGVHDEVDAGGMADACAELGEICHDADTGDAGMATTCHEVGHDGDLDECEAIYDECVDVCGGHEEDKCATLGTVCHDLDDGDAGLASECHEVGHAGEAEACDEIYDECIDLCGEHEGEEH